MKQIIALLTVLFLVPLSTSAQDFCEGNFNYDDDVDGSDAFTFKTDFGRSLLKNPCPSDGPAPVQKTGQTTSLHPGDDGDLERGMAWPDPRFTNNGDGTVADNLTGLIWLRDANCSLFNTPRTWEDALNIIVPQLADGYCGLTDGSSPGDWRLPNRNELFSLVDSQNWNPALPTGHPFINVQPAYDDYYWSSTTSSPSYIWHLPWGVSLGHGSMDLFNFPETDYHFIWPVRGGH